MKIKKMVRIVINTCYGGFGLSKDGIELYKKLTSDEKHFYPAFVSRVNPELIQVVEELGDKANGPYSELKIINIPDDVEWEVIDYDGVERVVDKQRTWC